MPTDLTKNQKVLTPNIAQVQLTLAASSKATLAAQTSLPVAQPSPATLTLKQPTSDGNRVTVVIECDDTVQSVTDDAGNDYALIANPVNPSDITKRFEIWRCDKVASMSGVTITTTKGQDITQALVSEVLPPPAYALAAIVALAQAVPSKPQKIAG